MKVELNLSYLFYIQEGRYSFLLFNNPDSIDRMRKEGAKGIVFGLFCDYLFEGNSFLVKEFIDDFNHRLKVLLDIMDEANKTKKFNPNLLERKLSEA